MNMTLFSFTMSMLWFTAFLVMCNAMRKKTGFIQHFGLIPLLILIFISLLRLISPLELPFAFVIRSHSLLPILQLILIDEWFFIGVVLVSVVGCFAVVWVVKAVKPLIKFFKQERLDIANVKKLEVVTNERVQTIMREVVKKSKSKRRYKIVVTSDLNSPMATGYFYPVIHIPNSILALSDERLAYILTHEWQHVLARDLWLRWLVEVLSRILWWNRPLQTFRKDLEQALEINCDLRVVKTFAGPDENTHILQYMQTLHIVASGFVEKDEKIKCEKVGMHLIKETDNNLKQRFEVISKNPKTTWKTMVVTIIVMLSLLIFSYSFVFQPYNQWPVEDGQHGDWVVYEDKIAVETLYLVKISDDVYHVYIGDKWIETIDEELLKSPPYNELTII